MAENKVSFTAESLRKMACKEGNLRTIYYDTKQAGLACVVSKKGIKTFALHAHDRTRKKSVQFTIGRFPDINANSAREIAQKLLTELANGVDISAAARSIREEPTVGDIFDNWLIHAKNRLRTWEDSERSYKIHIQPTFGKKQISTVTSQQVKTWHSNLLKKYKQRKTEENKVHLTKASANRYLALLRSIFNKEANHIDNPCNQVQPYRESSRERFLRPDELKVLFIALNDKDTPAVLQDFVILLLTTGARRSNIMSMTFREIDFENATWTIPASKSKNQEAMKIPLVPEAMAILNKRKKGATSIFVFPGTGATGHLIEPKRAWNTLIKRSGLDNLRLHDLRRTCGSYQAASGSNQAVISKSLGHKNIATTAIYTRMDLDPVRASMERAAKAMMETMNDPEKIIRIGDKS